MLKLKDLKNNVIIIIVKGMLYKKNLVDLEDLDELYELEDSEESEGTEESETLLSNGEEIRRIVYDIETSEENIGTMVIQSVYLYNEKDECILDDQDIIDNAIYFTESKIVDDLVKRYEVSKDIIEQDHEVF